MSSEQVLREFPWLENVVAVTRKVRWRSVDFRVSRVSLELLLRTDEDEKDDEKRTVVQTVFSFCGINGKSIRSATCPFNGNIMVEFLALFSRDQRLVTYIVEERTVYLEGRAKGSVVTLYKPPHGYPSVRQFVLRFRPQLLRMSK